MVRYAAVYNIYFNSSSPAIRIKQKNQLQVDEKLTYKKYNKCLVLRSKYKQRQNLTTKLTIKDLKVDHTQCIAPLSLSSTFKRSKPFHPISSLQKVQFSLITTDITQCNVKL